MIERYYALSQAFRDADPEKAEDMEEAFMDVLDAITKYDGCGIKFQVNKELGLHQNLEAATAFLQLNHHAQYLPDVFSNMVIAATAAIAAPISIVSGGLKYGPAVYELVTDVVKLDDNAIFVDGVKDIFLFYSDKALENKVPKYILIPVESGIQVYINNQYKNKN